MAHCALVGKYSKHIIISLLHSFSHTIVSATSDGELYPHVEKETKEDFVLMKGPGFDGDRRQDWRDDKTQASIRCKNRSENALSPNKEINVR